MCLVLWGSVLTCDPAVKIRGQGGAKVRAQSNASRGPSEGKSRGESEAVVRVMVRIDLLLALGSQTLI